MVESFLDMIPAASVHHLGLFREKVFIITVVISATAFTCWRDVGTDSTIVCSIVAGTPISSNLFVAAGQTILVEYYQSLCCADTIVLTLLDTY